WRNAMFSACNAAWPRRPERRELNVIKIRSSMPPAAYQRLDANPTIHMQMRFLGRTGCEILEPQKAQEAKEKTPFLAPLVLLVVPSPFSAIAVVRRRTWRCSRWACQPRGSGRRQGQRSARHRPRRRYIDAR